MSPSPLVLMIFAHIIVLRYPDHGFLYLNEWGLSRQFSVYPSIVTQAKVTVSDLAPGIGAGEDFFLVDSALRRIAMWEASRRDL